MHVIETVFTAAAIILLAVLIRTVFVYFSPERDCRWCKDKPRGRRCWRCKGTRRTWRLGARQVHKVKLALLQAWDEWR
jgi:hypothetical protein